MEHIYWMNDATDPLSDFPWLSLIMTWAQSPEWMFYAYGVD
jgi:hypothetical protein